MQNKFNLLREESEGYAKLITEFSRFFGLDATATGGNGPAEVIGKLQGLIGSFDLDPNRVVDILLECAERRFDRRAASAASAAFPHQQVAAFLRLLDLFKASTVTTMLGFKFRFYAQATSISPAGAGSAADVASSSPAVAPGSLFALAALLIQENRVDLADLYPHVRVTTPSTPLPSSDSLCVFQLSPSDETLVANRNAFVAAEQKKAAKMNVVSLVCRPTNLQAAIITPGL